MNRRGFLAATLDLLVGGRAVGAAANSSGSLGAVPTAGRVVSVAASNSIVAGTVTMEQIVHSAIVTPKLSMSNCGSVGRG